MEILLDLFINPEVGSDKFLCTIRLSPNCKVSLPRRLHSSVYFYNNGVGMDVAAHAVTLMMISKL
jgi:hypothetical protein